MFKLEFSTDNAAFEPCVYLAVRATLRQISYAVKEGASKGGIRDENGNTIGSWSLTTE